MKLLFLILASICKILAYPFGGLSLLLIFMLSAVKFCGFLVKACFFVPALLLAIVIKVLDELSDYFYNLSKD